jgi:hypothetical protein
VADEGAVALAHDHPVLLLDDGAAAALLDALAAQGAQLVDAHVAPVADPTPEALAPLKQLLLLALFLPFLAPLLQHAILLTQLALPLLLALIEHAVPLTQLLLILTLPVPQPLALILLLAAELLLLQLLPAVLIQLPLAGLAVLLAQFLLPVRPAVETLGPPPALLLLAELPLPLFEPELVRQSLLPQFLLLPTLPILQQLALLPLLILTALQLLALPVLLALAILLLPLALLLAQLLLPPQLLLLPALLLLLLTFLDLPPLLELPLLLDLLPLLELPPLAPLALLLLAAYLLPLLALLLHHLLLLHLLPLLELLLLLLLLAALIPLALLEAIVPALLPVSRPFTRIGPLAPAEPLLVELGQHRTARGDPPVRGFSRGRGQAGCRIHEGSRQRTRHDAKALQTGECRRQRRGGEEKTGEELKAHGNPVQRLANHPRR